MLAFVLGQNGSPDFRLGDDSNWAPLCCPYDRSWGAGLLYLRQCDSRRFLRGFPLLRWFRVSQTKLPAFAVLRYEKNKAAEH